MKKILTLDVGTTAVKAGIFDEQLRTLGFCIREYQLLTPQSDYVELPADVYWENAVAGIRQVMSQTDTDAGEVSAVICTTQGETMIPVDANGNVLHNAVVWLDARAKQQAQKIATAFSQRKFYEKTGVPQVNGYCPVAKLLWLKEERPEVYEQTEKVLLLEDYLVYQLSGKFVTNPALMCSTGYFDIVSDCIWQELFDRFQLDSQKIPEVMPCGKVVGTLSEQAARELGLTVNTVVCTGAMDQVASAIGAGNLYEGVVTETTGTCQTVAATTDHLDLSKGSFLTVYSHAIPGKYLLVNVSQTAGMILKWFRNEFCKDLMMETNTNVFAWMDQLADVEPPLSKGLTLYPHLTGIQAPYADEHARGVFFGVGLDTNRGCFIRAIMESVGYMLRESIQMMGLSPQRILSLGGGAKSDVWNQIKADVCHTVIGTMKTEETASLGAAMLAARACGLIRDLESAAELIECGKIYQPDAAAGKQYDQGYAVYEKMHEQFRPLFSVDNSNS